jgi:hypothetical protein
MPVPAVRRASPAILLLVLAAGTLAAAQRDPLPFAPADAERFVKKLAVMAERAEQPAGRTPGAPLRTDVTEQEVNAFLQYRGAAVLPAGLTSPAVVALGDGRMAGRAEIDLDAVRQWRQRGLLDPMRYMRGRLPVRAIGVLLAQDGTGRFELESASVSGLPVPKTLLAELVAYYSRTPAHPNGFELDAPFQLPAGIRAIEVGAGQAVIVQ